MSVPGILSSRSQRKLMFLASITLLLVLCLAMFILYAFTPDTRGWNLIIGVVVAVTASGMFALFSAFYLWYFFTDPFDAEAASQLLPKDVKEALEQLARNATEYRIYVRTGRHFRSSILPLLVEKARARRIPIRIEAVLLDFRDEVLCDKYAKFRRDASFDRDVWNLEYVQTEIMATILKLITAARESSSLIEADLYLSKRLSTFRIEGTSDEIIVTREDPTDNAARYRRSDPNFAGFLNEFTWIRQEAFNVKEASGAKILPATLQEMFGDIAAVKTLLIAATEATAKGSPYVR